MPTRSPGPSSTISPKEPVRFPGPVLTQQGVIDARDERTRRIVRVALAGVVVRLVIVAAELAGVYLFGSAALLVDALASLGDVVASLFLIVAVWLASRPPDEDHPFGHGRYEPLAGLQLGIFLAGVGMYLAARQTWAAATAPLAADLHPAAMLIPLVAALLLELAGRLIRRIGRRHHSTALVAEAAHFRIDALTSLLAAVGVGTAAAFPDQGGLIDRLGAIALALVMVLLGMRAAWENLNQLTDHVPESARFTEVRAAAQAVSGVRAVEKVRIQHAGPDAHVDIDIEVDPALRVDEAHGIAQQVRAAIVETWPSVREVVVHVEPFYANDH